MDDFLRTIFGVSNSSERRASTEMSSQEHVGTSSTHPGRDMDLTNVVETGSGSNITDNSRSNVIVDAEMTQASNEDIEGARMDTGGMQTPVGTSGSATPRPNRRARVEEDDDNDRDRRHPSQRTVDTLPNPTQLPSNDMATENNSMQPETQANAENAQSTQQPRPRRRPGLHIGFGLGMPPCAGDPSSFFEQLRNGSSAQQVSDSTNSTTSGGTDLPGSAGAPSAGAANVDGSPTNGRPSRAFTAGLSFIFDANGNAVSTRLRRFPTPMNPATPMNVDAPQGTPAPPNVQPGDSQAAPEPATEPGQGALPDGLETAEGEIRNFADLAQRLGLLGDTLNMLGETFGMRREEREDPERAKRLVLGLEEVPVGLVRRLERVGGAPGGRNEAGADNGQGVSEGCAICLDKLLEGETDEIDWNDKGKVASEGEVVNSRTENATANSTDTPTQEQSAPSLDGTLPAQPEGETQESSTGSTEKKLPKIVCLPCAHVFHASCLIPWFSRPRQTTCPTCRFNIDPENLTYRRTVPLPRRTSAMHQASAVPPIVPGATAENAPIPGAIPIPVITTTEPPSDQNQQTPSQAPAANTQPATTNGPPPRPPNGLGEQTIVLGIDLVFGLPPGFNPGPAGPAAETEGQMDVDEPTGPSEDLPAPTNQADGGNTQPPAQDRAQFERAMAEHARNAIRSLFGLAPPAPMTNPNGEGNPETNPPANAGANPGQHPPANGEVPLPSINLPSVSPTGPTAPGAVLLPNFAQMFGNLLSPRASNSGTRNPPTDPAATEPQNVTDANPGSDEAEGTAPSPTQQNVPQNGLGRGLDILFGIHALPFLHIPGRGSGVRPPRPRPTRERKDWTLPPAPGLTLRQRVEQKERDLGIRCNDVSCGIGPSDEEPVTEANNAERVRQLSIRLFGKTKDDEERVCAHTFHASCLVSAQRVALRGSEEIVKDGEVEVSCPVCRASGCLLKQEWDEGVQAL